MLRIARSFFSPHRNPLPVAYLWIAALFLLSPFAIRSQALSSLAERNPQWATLVDKSLNLYRVSPTLYRGAQFTQSNLSELEKLGIRSTVDLRYFHSDYQELQGSHIQPVRVRTNTWNIGDPAVIAALSAIRRGEKYGPVLLHCHHGSDRTGLVIAMYRIVYQNWTKDAAIDELRNGGYGYSSIWGNIPAYIKNADAEKIRRAVDAELSK
jgi:protein tyrosine/serine phosphatase